MTWMLTHNGAQVDLSFIGQPAEISILDIAASLSKINRFTGHTSRLYSVAEHSLHVSHVMERDLQIRSPKALLAGLLHDAHESYIGDMATPLKQALAIISKHHGTLDAWAAIEQRAETAVRARFDVLQASQQYRTQIKYADLIMLATERAALLPPTGPAWGLLRDIPQAIGVDLGALAGMTHEDWREAFLERFSELRAGITLGRHAHVPASAEGQA